MDPNEALRALRSTIAFYDESQPPRRVGDVVQDCHDLREAFSALDDWLTKGGGPPMDWHTDRCDYDCEGCAE